MKARKTVRVHTIDSGYHWAISVNKAGICPACATPNGQRCIDIFKMPLPITTVHVARVRALGHGVR